MHYYKFNIADWALHTSHLNLWEEAIYFRLINFYYDTETPIPLDLKPIIRRLRLDLSTGDLENVLIEFFVKTESGYIHKRCEEVLKDYRKTNKKNKANGAKGGRPAKTKGSEITQTKPSGLIKETQTKGNQELRTKNQELETNNQDIKTLVIKSSTDHMLFAEGMYSSILKVAPKTKKPNFVKWADDIRLMNENDKCALSEMANVFRWVKQDEFWKTNILSPSKFRKQYSVLHAKWRSETTQEEEPVMDIFAKYSNEKQTSGEDLDHE